MEQDGGGPVVVVHQPPHRPAYDAAEMGWSSGVALMASVGAVGFSIWALVSNGGTRSRVKELEGWSEEIDKALRAIQEELDASRRRWEQLRDEFDASRRQLENRFANLAK
jgi:hypothetical protein